MSTSLLANNITKNLSSSQNGADASCVNNEVNIYVLNNRKLNLSPGFD